jgi:hypothetical protein
MATKKSDKSGASRKKATQDLSLRGDKASQVKGGKFIHVTTKSSAGGNTVAKWSVSNGVAG